MSNRDGQRVLAKPVEERTGGPAAIELLQAGQALILEHGIGRSRVHAAGGRCDGEDVPVGFRARVQARLHEHPELRSGGFARRVVETGPDLDARLPAREALR